MPHITIACSRTNRLRYASQFGADAGRYATGSVLLDNEL